ncbi:lysozyme P [Drosophila grimshawi]|uniref:lysozyme n=1 Tax=Drosophila grimshawi TaxID=7222 RepID=B4J6D3_DROGR|nr:lysozyme P [Drosophila grimshawi]EDW00906.1 GH21143 [Drosophila grimshawi]
MAEKDLSFKWSVLLMVLQLILAGTAEGQRILDRCTLAVKMDELGVPRDELARYVFIARELSNFRTNAVSSPDPQNYRNYGIFQISDGWWCLSDKRLSTINICKVDCEQLLSDNIRASVKCAQEIKKTHGWDAWQNVMVRYDESGQTSVDDCFPEETSVQVSTANDTATGGSGRSQQTSNRFQVNNDVSISNDCIIWSN